MQAWGVENGAVIGWKQGEGWLGSRGVVQWGVEGKTDTIRSYSEDMLPLCAFLRYPFKHKDNDLWH